MAAPLYDDLGQRLTDCCAAYSTYAECGTFDKPGETTQILCCKGCYHPVALGQGDGSEFRPGVDAETYFRVTLARDRLDPLTGFPHHLQGHQMAALREDVVASFTQDPELTWNEYAARVDGRWGGYADVLHGQQVRALRLLEKSEALNTQRDEPADSHDRKEN